MSKYKPVDIVKLFKKSPLALLNGAIHPLARGCRVILDGASECLSGIDPYQRLNYLDATLAIMSIVKNYLEDIDRIRDTPSRNVHEIMDDIPAGLMENMRLILTVLETPQAQVDRFSNYEIHDKYLSGVVEASTSAARGSNNDRHSERFYKCLRTLNGMQYNPWFFRELARGMTILRGLMTCENARDRAALQSQIRNIINQIAEDYVTPAPPKTNSQLLEYLNRLRREDTENE